MLSARLIPIKSTCFNASGYFRGRAAFRYRNGHVIFRSIPVTLWQQFMEARSKGTFFREKIKGLHGAGSGTSPLAQTPGIFSQRQRMGYTASDKSKFPPDYSRRQRSQCGNPDARLTTK